MKKYYLGLIALYCFIYILPLGGRPMIAPDEYRYGEIPREMIESGDWVTPKLLGIRYFEKPVMGYWLNAVSILLFGENGFAVRFASAFTTGLAALLLLLLIRYGAGVENVREYAALAAALFLTFCMVYGVGTFAVLDAPTAFFLTAALVSFFLAYRREKSDFAKILLLALTGIAVGCAFLTKGFLAFAVPAVTILPFLIWERRWKDIFILPWIPAVFAALIILPWAVLIHQREPDFWHYFFWVEHWQRFFAKVETQHPQPFWFFLPILLGGTLPWAVFLPCIFIPFKRAWRKIFSQPLLRYAVCWTLFPFLLFSISSGKLATYILPCFAPLAILFSYGLIEYFRNGGRKIFDWTVKILLFALLAGSVGFAMVQIIADYGVFRGLFSAAERWKWLLCGVAAIWWSAALWNACRKREYRKKLVWLLLGPLPAFFLANYIVPTRLLESKAQGLFLKQFKDRIKPGVVIVAHPNVMHAVAWEFKNAKIYLLAHGGELEVGLKYPDSKYRLLSVSDYHAMLKRKLPEGGIVHIMRGNFREYVPPAQFEVYEQEIMFSHFKNKRRKK